MSYTGSTARRARRGAFTFNPNLALGSSYSTSYSGIGESPSLSSSVAGAVVRQGSVSVKEEGTLTSWVWKVKWLILKDMTLTLHKSAGETAPQQIVILLRDITSIDRTDLKPYCLLMETQDRKRYHFSLKSDEELYGWQDDIHSRSPLLGFSNPYNIVHKVHVGFDPVSGAFTGMPYQWSKLLTKSREDYAKDPQAMPTLSAPPAYHSMPSSAPPATKKHEKYYYEDGNLVLQAGDTLFRVWDGTIRRHATAFPLPTAKKPTSDENPLVLEDVSTADFERLLWILYPPCVIIDFPRSNSLIVLDSVLGQCLASTSADWTAILALATKYSLSDVRDLAIRELGKLSLDPVEKIALQQMYTIDRKWAGDAFIALCTRAPALKIEEGKKLGIEMTVQVASAREKLNKWGRKPEEIKKVVAEVWGITVETPVA